MSRFCGWRNVPRDEMTLSPLLWIPAPRRVSSVCEAKKGVEARAGRRGMVEARWKPLEQDRWQARTVGLGRFCACCARPLP